MSEGASEGGRRPGRNSLLHVQCNCTHMRTSYNITAVCSECTHAHIRTCT